MSTPSICVVVPCFNEEAAIATVINDFTVALPDARIVVFDNASTDCTADVARKAGAEVRHVGLKGKGNVVRRMFADVDADVYLMVDGDATYDASAAPALVRALVRDGLDMVVGARKSVVQESWRPGHRWGNRMLTGMVSRTFGRSFDDMLSGYRVFSRRFVRSFPAHSVGFEVETELAVHALSLRLPVREIATQYGARMEGSSSKLNTWRDGWRILKTIVKLAKNERPVVFFTSIAGALALLATGLGIPLVITYAESGLVPRLPTAVLCTSLILLAALSFGCGLILDTVTRGRREAMHQAYLAAGSCVGSPR